MEGKTLTTQLVELPTKHQTIDLCAFNPTGFAFDFIKQPGFGVWEDFIYTPGTPPHPTWAQIGGWMCQLLLVVWVIT